MVYFPQKFTFSTNANKVQPQTKYPIESLMLEKWLLDVMSARRESYYYLLCDAYIEMVGLFDTIIYQITE